MKSPCDDTRRPTIRAAPWRRTGVMLGERGASTLSAGDQYLDYGGSSPISPLLRLTSHFSRGESLSHSSRRGVGKTWLAGEMYLFPPRSPLSLLYTGSHLTSLSFTFCPSVVIMKIWFSFPPSLPHISRRRPQAVD